MPEPERSALPEQFAPRDEAVPQRSLDDISAQHDAEQTALAETIARAEQKRVRCAQIGEALYEMHMDGGDGEEYLAVYIGGDAFPDQTNEILYQAESNRRERSSDFDIMNLPPRTLARVLERGLQAADEITAVEESADLVVDAQTAQAHMLAHAQNAENTAEAAMDAAEDKEATLAAFQNWYGEQNGPLDALQNAHTMPAGLDAQKARLIQFQRMASIAQTISPQDHKVISRQLDRMDMSHGVQDPVSFARAFIFDSPNSQIRTGVSEAAQIAIAECLGIERPTLEVTTGSEMSDVFEKGVGTKTVRDPTTGELRKEPVFLQPGEFEPLREGQAIGLTPTGERAMRFEAEVGDFTVILPGNAGPEDMVMYGVTGQIMSQLHAVNMAEIMFPGHSLMDRGGGVLDIRMPNDFNRAQRLCQIFYDRLAGYDGELLDQSDLDRIPYLMQFQTEKGGAVLGDVNPAQMKADYRRQNVLNKDGALNWERFATMIDANRTGLWTGEENFGQTARDAA